MSKPKFWKPEEIREPGIYLRRNGVKGYEGERKVFPVEVQYLKDAIDPHLVSKDTEHMLACCYGDSVLSCITFEGQTMHHLSDDELWGPLPNPWESQQ